jgi:hypothetical protein
MPFHGRRRHLLVIAAMLFAWPAFAEDTRERAREAYDRGTAAHKRGDFAQAAQDYALADDIAPSPVALRAALDEAVRADDAALGMELVTRASRGPIEGDLATSVSSARTKFQARAGVVRVHCPTMCMATLDSRPLDVKKDAWATIGQHTVVVQSGDDTQQRIVEVKADAPVEVTLAPRPAPPGPAPAPYVAPAPEPARAPQPGLPPVVFFVGAAATVALGGATVWSALDTSKKHADFTASHCDTQGSIACDRASSSGASAQTRTNVLLATTAVVGAAMVLVGVAFTRWSDPPARVARAGGWYFEF